MLDKITYADLSSTRFDYNGYAQVYKVRSVAADSASHVLNYVRTNLQTPASNQTDCPKFTETQSFVENFNGGNEVTVTNTAPTSSSYSLPGGLTGNAAKIEVAMTGHPDGLYSRTYVGESAWKEGLTLATEDCMGTNCSDRKRWTWTDWTQDNTSLSYSLNPRVIESRVGDSVNTKKSRIEYWLQEGTNIAIYGLVKSSVVYDTDLSTILKKTYTTYNLDAAYTSRRIIGLPSLVELRDGNEVLWSKVTNVYDGENFSQEPNQIITPTRHDTTNYASSFVVGRGNLTSTTRHDVLAESAAVTSRARYDTAGSVVAQLDPLDHKVTISYADVFNDNENRNSFAYPTTVTDPAGNSSTVKYRYDIGANVRAQSPAPAGNATGKITERIFDSLGRLQKELITNTGAYTRYEYPSNGIQQQVFTTIVDIVGIGTIDAADEVMTESWSDGAGRVLRSRTEHPGSIGGWAATITEFDILGRVKRASVPTEVSVSNPLDPNSWQQAGDDLTRGFLWTHQKYDWMNRVVRKINTDGDPNLASNDSDIFISYSTCGCAGNLVTTVENERVPIPGTSNFGRRTQKTYEDILGRTFKTEVLNWDGSVYSSVVETFNGRDQVTNTRQNGDGTNRDVTMTFDGHGRMKTRHYPIENAGANTTWNYNADDTISNVVDPRGVITNFTYNSRRLTTAISYDPNTTGVADAPDVGFGFDNAGNRTSMTDGTGNTSYVYDSMSRIASETKYIAELSQSFTINYTYSLTGAVQTYTDPQDVSRKAEYTFDRTGRTAEARNLYAGVEKQKLNDTQYRAWGALKKHTFVTIGASTVSNPVEFEYDNRLNVSRHYSPYPPNPSGYHHNVLYTRTADGKVSLSTDALGPSFTRNFEYDHVGRVTNSLSGQAIHGIPNTDTPYRATLAYNSFSETTSITGKHWEQANPAYLPSTDSSTGRDMTAGYDAAGSITQERMRTSPTILNRTYTHDAAGRNTNTFDPALRTSEQDKNTVSTFDGNGWLVKKETTTVTGWTKTFEFSSTVLQGETIGSWEYDNAPQTDDKKKFISSANGVKMSYLSWATFWDFEWLSPEGTTMYGMFGTTASQEFDARGGALGIENPYQGGGGYGGGSGYGDAQHYARCEWGGLEISCGMADRLWAVEVSVNQSIEKNSRDGKTPSRHLAYEPKHKAPASKANRDTSTAQETKKTDRPADDKKKATTVPLASVPNTTGQPAADDAGTLNGGGSENTEIDFQQQHDGTKVWFDEEAGVETTVNGRFVEPVDASRRQVGAVIDPRLTPNLRNKVLTVLRKPNCTDIFQEMLLRLAARGERYATMDFEKLFDRVNFFTISNKDAGHTGTGATAWIDGKGRRYIFYAELGTTNPDTLSDKHVSNTIAELAHHAKEKGRYSDQDLDNAAKDIMSAQDYAAALAEKKRLNRTAGFIGHNLVAKYCQ